MNSAVVAATKRINKECADCGDVRGARALLEQLVLSRGLRPTLVTANILVKTYRSARDPEGAEAMLANDFPNWGVCADGCTYSTLVDAYGLSDRLPDARRVASAAEAAGAADSRVYSALLRFVPAAEVSELMAHLAARRVTINTALCNAALSTLANAGRADEAQAFVQCHMLHGPAAARPDSRSRALVLKALCTAGDTAAAESLVLSLFDSGERVDAAAVSLVMNAFVCKQPPDLPTAYRLMRGATAHGVRPDVAMYNVLLKGHAACSPPQPERAEALLAEIRSAGRPLTWDCRGSPDHEPRSRAPITSPNHEP